MAMAAGLESRLLSHWTASSLSSHSSGRASFSALSSSVPFAGNCVYSKSSSLLPIARCGDGLCEKKAVKGSTISLKSTNGCGRGPLQSSVPTLGNGVFGGKTARWKYSALLCRATPAEEPETSAIRLHVTPQELWEEDLKPYVQYLGKQDQDKILQGLNIAYAAHDGQKRKSGEPYIIHPVAVARILGELRLDVDSVIAGLLHDTVEDTDAITFEEIEATFGLAVRKIVEGETKVSKVTSKVRKAGELMETGQAVATSKGDDAAGDLQQMFLAMTEEVRVIIVKLADRLHNMRTLGFMPAHKQKLIAGETLQVFAPLADLLGLEVIGRELEALSFPRRYPEEAADIARWMDALALQQEPAVLTAQALLNEALLKDELLQRMVSRVEVVPSAKDAYQVHRKIEEGRANLEEIRDVAQLLIILHMRYEDDDGRREATYASPQQVCYHVLGLIHNIWPPIPGRMKDYIATPKPNGYRSLHTVVLPLGAQGEVDIFPLGLLIRTAGMHRVSQLGIVAPHADLGDLNQMELDEMTSGVNWLCSLKEWQREFLGKMSPREFVDTITGEVLGKRVFTFTPKGEVMSVPKGATVVDYAYQIHTDVGNTMVGARVNGAMVDPSYELRNADVVQILTYDGPISQKAISLHREWLKNVATRAARHKISKFLRDYEDSQPPEDTKPLSTNGLQSEAVAPEGPVCPKTDKAEDKVSIPRNGAATNVSLDGSVTLEKMPNGASNGSSTDEMYIALKIRGKDRIGLLADVSGIITKHNMFIETYSGTNEPGTGFGRMNFKLVGSPKELTLICEALRGLDGVVSWDWELLSDESMSSSS